MIKSSAVSVIALCLYLHSFAQAPVLDYIFKEGDAGYACFRIPAIIKTSSGSLLAFAEARKKNCSDAGDIDLVLRRSVDGGKSWSPMRVVWDDADNTCGNPAPVVDERTGKIVLVSTWNLGSDREPAIIDLKSKDTRRIFVLSSSDDGLHWSEPREITSQVKLPSWTWYATGPGNGIQIRSKKYRDRLLIPCDHIVAGTKKYYSHVIYSDDGGDTWGLGGSTPDDQVNECAVAELSKGRILLNMRNYNQQRYRQTSVSRDGGKTWSALQQDASLPEPVCQASLIRYGTENNKSLLAFSNPASQNSRTNMTVRLSKDEGKTWAKSYVLYAGPSAYSNLVTLPSGNLGCLFEAGIKTAYEGIAFREILFEQFK